MNMTQMANCVAQEAQEAEDRYGHMRSTHEALGVLVEEMSELKDAIRRNNMDAVRREALQVSAVALRLACENHHEFIDRSRK